MEDENVFTWEDFMTLFIWLTVIVGVVLLPIIGPKILVGIIVP